jgi:uncharacterized protein YbaP (TraB family)
MPKRQSLVLLFAALLLMAGAPAATDRSIHFYRAESPAGAVSYLYPSFHLRDDRIIRPPVAVLDRVKRLIVESDIVEAERHPEKLVSFILSPQPLDLAALFSAAEIAVIRQRAACNGIPRGVERLKPLFIGMFVALPCPKPGAVLYERVLQQEAQKRGLEIVALETGAEEFAALFSLPEPAFIDAIKRYTDHPEAAQQQLDRMVELYNAADYDGLYEFSLDNMGEKPEYRQLFLEKVLLERNRNMVARMLGALGQGDALVVVGAAHLPGQGGIVDLLQQQGYKITMIDAAMGALH